MRQFFFFLTRSIKIFKKAVAVFDRKVMWIIIDDMSVLQSNTVLMRHVSNFAPFIWPSHRTAGVNLHTNLWIPGTSKCADSFNFIMRGA